MRTWSARSVAENTKSSTSEPSRARACARMPAKAGSTSAAVSSGTNRRQPRRTRAGWWRGGARSAPVRHQRRNSRQVPGQASVGPRSRGPDPAQRVGVACGRHQRGRAHQDLAVECAGSGGRRGRAGRGRAPGRSASAPARAAPGAGAGRRRGTARSAGPAGRRPAPPGGRTRRRRRTGRCRPRSAPRAWRRPMARPGRLDALHAVASATAPPASRTSSARARATAGEVGDAGLGRVQAAIPAAWGSSSRMPSASRRRSPVTPFSRPRRSSSSRRSSSPGRSPRSPCRSARASIATLFAELVHGGDALPQRRAFSEPGS